MRSIFILGTRGIPAAHGGFETFAEHLAIFLAERGWSVTVYCQHDAKVVRRRITRDYWNGIERRHVHIASTGPLATLEFDWHCVRDAAGQPGTCLVLGYNSAIFLAYLRLKGGKIVTNMDGIEWRRSKWGRGARAWFWANEWIAGWMSHRLIADHPVIADHLATRRFSDMITVIPYGGTEVMSAPEEETQAMGLQPGRYLISVARIEPENSIQMIVEAFSRRHRGAKLVIIGAFNDEVLYHRRVRAVASDEVVFPGAIYDKQFVAALRFHARAYLHGHTVGGTNPSLVEALWAGNPVIAHDNTFNRWTAGDAALFFNDVDECERLIERALSDDEFIRCASQNARRHAAAYFNWDDILEAYETVATSILPGLPQIQMAAIEPVEEVVSQGRLRWR